MKEKYGQVEKFPELDRLFRFPSGCFQFFNTAESRTLTQGIKFQINDSLWQWYDV